MIKRIVLLSIFMYVGPVFSKGICDVSEVKYQEAFNEYRENGSVSFIRTMLEGGKFSSDEKALNQSEHFQRIESSFGDVGTTSVIIKKSLGDRSCFISSILEYELGPVFMSLMYYKTSKEIIVSSFSFQTEAEVILSSNVLFQD
ncbi:hypothetical protein VV869_18480 [Photobacterium sp. MCCC 1A19761]|uniref:hypothetical protein n=1 Tax=Photobacterium sp. MCCC 1A19761 TaxID=3115000 RepID=UPI00307E0951